jgi:aspartate carbamoyltransferase catalytic subunit
MAIVKNESSTRTRLSFEVAMKRLGGEVIVFDLDKNSSISKGETLEDTIKVIGSYVDLMVLRCSEVGSLDKLSSLICIPLINAGDGNGEHPTQALQDMYTIYQYHGRKLKEEGLCVMLVGDLKNSRTVHSLIHLLGLCRNRLKVHLVSPSGLELPDIYYKCLSDSCVEHFTSNDLRGEIARGNPDVVYMTREQRERNKDNGSGCGNYSVLGEFEMGLLSPTSIIMHPMPRCEEIPVRLDSDRRCVYFLQAKNGMYIRMALIHNLFTYNSFYTDKYRNN